MSLLDCTAVELAAKIKAGEVTAVEAMQAVVAQIEKSEDKLNCYVTFDKEKALQAAAKADEDIKAGKLTGPLAGVPFAIKDNMCTEGMLTTCSSKILGNFVPTFSSEAVIKLQEAGAVIIGKTNMDEFAMGSTTETSAFGATKNPRNTEHVPGGSSGGSAAAVVAYHLFGHVRQRVSAWKDPMAVYQNEGYQIVQSLFAIGTGGWFGMGLYQGSPESIPVVKNDFIFSAICEELGGIFAICLILVCMSFFLMIVNIALRIINPFYKLIALGLGVEYAFQVFLTIGGATKFIPMTGVTLPLVSYGGSSLLTNLMMIGLLLNISGRRQKAIFID